MIAILFIIIGAVLLFVFVMIARVLRSDKYKNILSKIGAITLWIVVAFLLFIVLFNMWIIFKPPPRLGPSTKTNMHILQLVLEDFAEIAMYYPANLNVSVRNVLQDLGKDSDVSITIAGIDKDTIFPNEIGSTTPAMLSRWSTQSFHNPYDDSKPVLIVTKIDPPAWNKKIVGVVYYVPLGVKGNIAKGYKIYGAGKDGLLSLVLSSESNKKDEN
jgi:energy-coupling factor transporter transmembrane protein EcfT